MSSESSRHATTATAPGWVRNWRVIISSEGVRICSSTKDEIRPVPSSRRPLTGHFIGSSTCIVYLFLAASAASMSPANSGCGFVGRDFSSGCACVPT